MRWTDSFLNVIELLPSGYQHRWKCYCNGVLLRVILFVPFFYDDGLLFFFLFFFMQEKLFLVSSVDAFVPCFSSVFNFVPLKFFFFFFCES